MASSEPASLAADRGEQLDALNRTTLRKHYRNIVDNSIGDPDRYPHSALPGVLADLRANAAQVYGDADAAPAKRPRTRL